MALLPRIEGDIADKTWARFKNIFAEEYHDLVEETKFVTGDAGFHSTNRMQQIGGALEHLAMAEGSDRYIVTNLTEAVDKLTKNNPSLTTQLIDAMKLNLEMSKKINLKSTQGQDPKVKLLACKAKRKAAF